MKKLFLLLLIFPVLAFGQVTTGFHRVNQALARANSGVSAQVVPFATISVTSTATGGAATIYYDPLLSSLISPSVVTADGTGNYDYYLPLNYCVTETISSPGQGVQTIPNICNNSSGGGATLPASALVFGLTSTTSRAATYGDITSLFSGCSGTQYLGADGACHTATGGSGLPSGNPLSVVVYNGSGNNGQQSNATVDSTYSLFSFPGTNGLLNAGRFSGSDVAGQYNTAKTYLPVDLNGAPYGDINLNPLQTYNISQPFIVSRGASLDCHFATVNWMSATGYAVLIGDTYPGTTGGVGNNLTTIRNCKFFRNGQTTYNGTDFNGAIYLGADPNNVITPSNQTSSQIRIENTYIAGFRYAVTTGKNAYMLAMTNVWLRYNYDGVYSPGGVSNSGERNLISDSVISGNTNAGIESDFVLVPWYVSGTSFDFNGTVASGGTVTTGAPSTEVATAGLTGGVITSISGNSSCCFVNPVSVAVSDSSGTGAVIAASASATTGLLTYTITNGGTGYTAPTFVVTGGRGSNGSTGGGAIAGAGCAASFVNSHLEQNYGPLAACTNGVSLNLNFQGGDIGIDATTPAGTEPAVFQIYGSDSSGPSTFAMNNVYQNFNHSIPYYVDLGGKTLNTICMWGRNRVTTVGVTYPAATANGPYLPCISGYVPLQSNVASIDNGTTAQTLNVYSTDNGTGSAAGFRVGFSGGGNVKLEAFNTGTASLPSIFFGGNTGGVDTYWYNITAASITPQTDNTAVFGGGSAHFLEGYFGTSGLSVKAGSTGYDVHLVAPTTGPTATNLETLPVCNTSCALAYVGQPAAVTTIASSATPAIVAANPVQTITLSANATPTVSGVVAGLRISLQICQPATGGPYTWTWPAAFHGGVTIGTTASTCSFQAFDSVSGTTFVAESAGVVNVAP